MLDTPENYAEGLRYWQEMENNMQWGQCHLVVASISRKGSANYHRAMEHSDMFNKKIIEIYNILKKHWPHIAARLINEEKWLLFCLAWANLYNQQGFENLLFKSDALFDLYHRCGKPAIAKCEKLPSLSVQINCAFGNDNEKYENIDDSTKIDLQDQKENLLKL